MAKGTIQNQDAMKFTIITIILILFTGIAHAQTFNEWFRQKKTQRTYLIQQIAALKIYLTYVKKGYQIAQKGLTLIGDIKNGNHEMDRSYFASLKEVNPSIRSSAYVASIVTYCGKISHDLEALKSWTSGNEQFTQKEQDYIDKLCDNLLLLCDEALEELTIVITASQSEMKDNERISRIDKIHSAMQEKYAFSGSFCNETRSLALSREKDQAEIQTLIKNHEL